MERVGAVHAFLFLFSVCKTQECEEREYLGYFIHPFPAVLSGSFRNIALLQLQYFKLYCNCIVSVLLKQTLYTVCTVYSRVFSQMRKP